MAPEVLIYISNVKKFLDNNQEAHDYFLKNLDENDFYSKIAITSQTNFEKTGDPMIHKNQFEEIKKTLLELLNKEKENNIFFDIKDFGSICLN